jgi:hypothetical protein
VTTLVELLDRVHAAQPEYQGSYLN